MRKIEKAMCEALNARRNWRMSNTEVVCEADGSAKVYLHGYLICRESANGKREYRDAGWQTVTTKSRLNALGADIRQHNWSWSFDGGREWEYGVFNS